MGGFLDGCTTVWAQCAGCDEWIVVTTLGNRTEVEVMSEAQKTRLQSWMDTQNRDWN
jgi:hypothetical protein